MTSVKAWEDLTEAEQAGVIQRTAALALDSPCLQEWTADRIRRESPEDSFMRQVADAMDAEIAAREARAKLRVVVNAKWRLPSLEPSSDAPELHMLPGSRPGH